MSVEGNYTIGSYRSSIKNRYLRRKDASIYILFLIRSIVWISSLCIGFVLIALISKVSPKSLMNIMTIDLGYAILISFTSMILSIFIVIFTGIPIAYFLVNNNEKKYKLFEALICFPILLPPTVAGLALLMTFGRRGLLGRLLSFLNISLPFTFFAVVIVQVFIISPFFIQIVKNEFRNIDPAIIEAAKVDGAGEKNIILKIYLPLAKQSILTGVVLCLLRGLGEFGATIMFAGNMVGKTQTMTLRIYSLYQLDVMKSVNLAVIQLVIVGLLFGVVTLIKKEKR